MPRRSDTQDAPVSRSEQFAMYENSMSGRDTTETVYQQLRRAILRCEIPSEAQLSQRELEQLLGVGRTPLREALRMLQREGLIEAEPNHRIRVAGFSISDLEQVYALRINLESLAVRFTVPSLQASELCRLEELLVQMSEMSTPEEYEQWEVPHRTFHLGLIAHAGPRIVAMIAQLSDHAERYRRFNTTEVPRGLERGMREHQVIMDACNARDAGAAAVCIARHYSSVALGILAVLAPEYDPVLVRTALHTVIQADAGRKNGAAVAK